MAGRENQVPGDQCADYCATNSPIICQKLIPHIRQITRILGLKRFHNLAENRWIIPRVSRREGKEWNRDHVVVGLGGGNCQEDKQISEKRRKKMAGAAGLEAISSS